MREENYKKWEEYVNAHAEDEAFEVVLCLHIYIHYIYMNVFCHVFAAYKYTIYMIVIFSGADPWNQGSLGMQMSCTFSRILYVP